jgi:alpha-beta hydrolase superfamily lysophospholipase
MMNEGASSPIEQDAEGKGKGWVVSHDGARIYVEMAGNGSPILPPILLVHGWTMSCRFWRPQMTGLSDRFQVVTMDLRAHGNSSKILEGHTMAAYSKDIQAVITALNLKRLFWWDGPWEAPWFWSTGVVSGVKGFPPWRWWR